MKTNKLKVLTWHIHGSYLYYLTQTPCEFYLPIKKAAEAEEGYGGKAGTFPWGENVHEIDVEDLKNADFDVILFQSKKNYLVDQYEILTEEQRRLPKVYLEHDPPRETPTDTKHIVNDSEVLLVHVTHFNNIMWDNNNTPSTVIEHGVTIPEGVKYTGAKNKGIVVVNNLHQRGRRLGLDIYEKVKKEVPLDLVGMNSHELGGVGEVQPPEMAQFMSEYRFFFNPIRYTSLGLAVCEAMMVGMPIVGLATTEMPTIIENNFNGYVDTDIENLITAMNTLIENKEIAHMWSTNARTFAKHRFGIERFTNNWLQVFEKVSKQNITRDPYSQKSVFSS